MMQDTVPMSQLFDGHCDCCDGSDELASTKCPNTCGEELEERMQYGRDKIALLTLAIAEKIEIVLPQEQALERLWNIKKTAKK